MANEVCDGALRAGDRMPVVRPLSSPLTIRVRHLPSRHLAVLMNTTPTEKLDDDGRRLFGVEGKVFTAAGRYIGYRGRRIGSAEFASYVKQDRIGAVQPAERRATAR